MKTAVQVVTSLYERFINDRVFSFVSGDEVRA